MCTAVRSDRSSSITPMLWRWMGPILVSPATSWVACRNWAIRPVGGASSTTASKAGRSPGPVRVTDSFTLPVSSTSRRPGAMVVAKSIAPILRSIEPARFML